MMLGSRGSKMAPESSGGLTLSKVPFVGVRSVVRIRIRSRCLDPRLLLRVLIRVSCKPTPPEGISTDPADKLPSGFGVIMSEREPESLPRFRDLIFISVLDLEPGKAIALRQQLSQSSHVRKINIQNDTQRVFNGRIRFFFLNWRRLEFLKCLTAGSVVDRRNNVGAPRRVIDGTDQGSDQDERVHDCGARAIE